MGVRRESVELSLQDVDFTTGMAKSAAATALLNKELRDLDGSSTKANRSTGQLADDGIKRTGTSARQADSDLNRYTGRLNALVSAAVTLGPALVPLSAGLIPGITGLAAGLGAAAGAAGVTVLAVHGMGDALKALDQYQLQPTAAHLQALTEKMAGLAPAGQDFVRFLNQLEPELHALQAAAQQGMFPGVEQGLRDLMPLLPQVQQIIGSIATELGNLTEKAGHGLANDSEFQAFFHYLQTDAAPTLDAFAKATGNVAAGLAQMTVDFAPVNRDFADGLVHASESFRQWADGLANTQSFRDFVNYIETNGPKAVDALEALGNAALGIAEAAAPMGAVVLPVLTALLNVIGAIGKSPIGPVIYTGVAAAIAFNKAGDLMSATLTRLGVQTAALSGEMRGLAASVAEVDAAAAAGSSSSAGKLGGVAGLLYGGRGLAITGGSALALGGYGTSLLADQLNPNRRGNDMSKLGSQSNVSQLANYLNGQYSSALPGQHAMQGFFGGIAGLFGTTSTEAGKQDVHNTDLGLAQMVQSGQGAQAAAIFDKITAAAQKQGVSIAQTAKQFSNYTSAARLAGVSTNGTVAAQQASAQASMQQAAALKEATDAALGAFDAETNWRQALKDATAQAAKNNAGIKGNSDAALQNRVELGKLAAAWNNQSDAVKNNVRRFDGAKRAFIDTATAMGVPIGQAKRLAAQFLQIPPKVASKVALEGASEAQGALSALGQSLGILNNTTASPRVSVDTGPAMFALRALSAALGNVSALKPTLPAHPGGPGSPFKTPSKMRASGGPIYGPGTSTSDSIPAYLSNGEYVVRAAAVAKYGTAMFDSLNAMRLAGGGPVRSTIDSVSGQKSYYVPLGAKNVDWAGAHKYADAERALDKLTKALDALTKSADGVPSRLDAASSALDDLKSQRGSLVSAVTSALSPDIFGGPSGSVFSAPNLNGTFASAMAALNKQGSNADAFLSAEQTLTDKHLSGAALTALLGTGNLATVQNFANQSASDLASYSSAYDTSTSKVNLAAGYAGDAGFGSQISAQTAVLKSIEARVADLTTQQKHAQSRADKAKQALSAKQAKQTGAAVAAAHNKVAKRAKNK